MLVATPSGIPSIRCKDQRFQQLFPIRITLPGLSFRDVRLVKWLERKNYAIISCKRVAIILERESDCLLAIVSYSSFT